MYWNDIKLHTWDRSMNEEWQNVYHPSIWQCDVYFTIKHFSRYFAFADVVVASLFDFRFLPTFCFLQFGPHICHFLSDILTHYTYKIVTQTPTHVCSTNKMINRLHKFLLLLARTSLHVVVDDFFFFFYYVRSHQFHLKMS